MCKLLKVDYAAILHVRKDREKLTFCTSVYSQNKERNMYYSKILF